MDNEIKIYDLDKDDFDNSLKCVSLGNFDGVHIGHQKLMDTNTHISKTENLIPSVLLFKENTKLSLNIEDKYITPLESKIDILKEIGIKVFYTVTFDDEFRNLSYDDFISDILVKKINAKAIVVGCDYRFGKNASGDVNTLREFEEKYGYKTYVEDFIKYNDEKVSSKTIRQLIADGSVDKANAYLTRPYKITGTVVDGLKRGRTLNFPTANLELDFNYVIPKDGVYLTRIDIDGNKHFGLTNIGTNPTFENADRKIETYILDFSDNIYGKRIEVEFLEFFRGDFKFESVDGLIRQMELDKKLAYEVIKDKYL